MPKKPSQWQQGGLDGAKLYSEEPGFDASVKWTLPHSRQALSGEEVRKGGLRGNQEHKVERPKSETVNRVIDSTLMRTCIRKNNEEEADRREHHRTWNTRNKHKEWRRRKSQRILLRFCSTGTLDESGSSGEKLSVWKEVWWLHVGMCAVWSDGQVIAVGKSQEQLRWDWNGGGEIRAGQYTGEMYWRWHPLAWEGQKWKDLRKVLREASHGGRQDKKMKHGSQTRSHPRDGNRTPKIWCTKIKVGENITEKATVNSATLQRSGIMEQGAEKSVCFAKRQTCQYNLGANASLYLSQEWDIRKWRHLQRPSALGFARKKKKEEGLEVWSIKHRDF